MRVSLLLVGALIAAGMATRLSAPVRADDDATYVRLQYERDREEYLRKCAEAWWRWYERVDFGSARMNRRFRKYVEEQIQEEIRNYPHYPVAIPPAPDDLSRKLVFEYEDARDFAEYREQQRVRYNHVVKDLHLMSDEGEKLVYFLAENMVIPAGAAKMSLSIIARKMILNAIEKEMTDYLSGKAKERASVVTARIKESVHKKIYSMGRVFNWSAYRINSMRHQADEMIDSIMANLIEAAIDRSKARLGGRFTFDPDYLKHDARAAAEVLKDLRDTTKWKQFGCDVGMEILKRNARKATKALTERQLQDMRRALKEEAYRSIAWMAKEEKWGKAFTQSMMKQADSRIDAYIDGKLNKLADTAAKRTVDFLKSGGETPKKKTGRLEQETLAATSTLKSGEMMLAFTLFAARHAAQRAAAEEPAEFAEWRRRELERLNPLQAKDSDRRKEVDVMLELRRAVEQQKNSVRATGLKSDQRMLLEIRNHTRERQLLLIQSGTVFKPAPDDVQKLGVR
ncbi:MAG: hypothetical protein JXR37_29570 [Kiritimatiellae bacterium]|nr:hypothetical protein [Kiritimatiellia bacterium]